MIVPADYVELARALAEGISGPAGAGMWTTGLSADGSEPATHYISAGLIDSDFADLLPLTTYDSDGVATTAPGQVDAIAAKADVHPTVIADLLDACHVTDEDAHSAMARMGLLMVVPAEVAV